MKLIKILIIIIANISLLLILLSISSFFSLMKAFENNSKFSDELKDYAKTLYTQIQEGVNNE